MNLHRIGAAVLALGLAGALSARKPQEDQGFRRKLAKDEQILHALNRLAYGPRPGDPEQVRKLGVRKWVDRQLHPERVPENPELLSRLAPLDSLGMDTGEILASYPPPQVIAAYAAGRLPMPADPERRAAVQRLLYRYRKRFNKKGLDAKAPEASALATVLTREQVRKLRDGTPEERSALLNSLPAAKLDEVAQALPPRIRGSLLVSAPEPLRRKLMFEAAPQQVVQHDLQDAKFFRAVYSNRQLEEVLVDFWFNHFNVFLEKGMDRFLVTSFERDAIRPHVLGRFRDLLVATAEHPAMLFYLDNWQSVAAGGGRGRKRRGLNENYARELLELHTLGVDGGYTQKDIVEVARCFTGWTIVNMIRGPRFEFDPKVHDDGGKVVLGMTIPPGGGEKDGLAVLDMLARRPATARFISRKLAQRFVADNPPEPLVQSMAETFQKTDGDLRAVMKTMLQSREFWSDGAYRAKIKSPFELVASAVRASDADVESASVLSARVGELGEPLYRKMEPTGYSNISDDWVNSAALLGRMNFALSLTGNYLPGVKVDGARWTGGAGEIARALLFTAPSAATRDAVARGLAAKNDTAGAAALVLGSPDFQRR